MPTLGDVLCNACQLLDSVKADWQKEGCWSVWDQAVRDGLSRELKRTYEASAAPPSEREAAIREKFEEILLPVIDPRAPYAKVVIDMLVAAARAAVPQAAPGAEVLAALEAIYAQAESWHTVHCDGPNSVQCDTICELLPRMKAAISEARAAAVPAPSQMDFWFKLADKVAQKYGVPFLQIDELGLFMQNEARHLLAGATAPPKEGK